MDARRNTSKPAVLQRSDTIRMQALSKCGTTRESVLESPFEMNSRKGWHHYEFIFCDSEGCS